MERLSTLEERQTEMQETPVTWVASLTRALRHSKGTSEFINHGEIYEFTIDLGATSDVFLAGHRLLLEISSSNFPRIDRNLNTGENILDATQMLTATNTVFHGQSHASALLVAVVPR